MEGRDNRQLAMKVHVSEVAPVREEIMVEGYSTRGREIWEEEERLSKQRGVNEQEVLETIAMTTSVGEFPEEAKHQMEK